LSRIAIRVGRRRVLFAQAREVVVELLGRVLLVSECEHLERLLAPCVHVAREVVEL
jgi:hypothetical protein